MPFKTGSWGPQAKERSKRRRRYLRNYDRMYRKLHPRTSEAQIRYTKTWQAKNKEKVKIHWITARHIKIPEGQLCELCHKELGVLKHHPDYSKPLTVQFLCRCCHQSLHPYRGPPTNYLELKRLGGG